MAILIFEFSWKFYSIIYCTFIEAQFVPSWFLVDIVYFVLSIFGIAIMAYATGEIFQVTLGLNYWIGVILITFIVGILNFYGKGLIERFKTFGTLSLMIGYLVFASLVIFQTWDQAWDVLATGDTSYMTGTVSVFAVIWSGILYVGYNLAVYPATLFSIERQQSRKESVWSGKIGRASCRERVLDAVAEV